MNISMKDINDIKVVQFDGKLDSNTAKDAEVSLNDLLSQEANKILVDFEKLDYTSSAGLRVLLSTAKQLKAVGGELRLCNLNETVQEIFDMSGFSSILSVFASESDAIEGFYEVANSSFDPGRIDRGVDRDVFPRSRFLVDSQFDIADHIFESIAIGSNGDR